LIETVRVTLQATFAKGVCGRLKHFGDVSLLNSTLKQKYINFEMLLLKLTNVVRGTY